MTTTKRQNPQRFVPVVGEVYENAGGGRFLCKRSNGCDARMQNILSGWDCVAHGIVRYEDGTIEWDYSTGGTFLPKPEEVRHRQISLMNALLCCAI